MGNGGAIDVRAGQLSTTLKALRDIGFLDEDGYLFIVDRKKDIIIRGGENIGCGQVEAALLLHPDVREAAVHGVPDEHLDHVESLDEQLVAFLEDRVEQPLPDAGGQRRLLGGHDRRPAHGQDLHLAALEIVLGDDDVGADRHEWRVAHGCVRPPPRCAGECRDRKSTRLNSSH